MADESSIRETGCIGGNTSQNGATNAPGFTADVPITVTNPCHPLCGREVEFLKGPKTRSSRWICARLPDGNLRLMRREWTSLAAVDPYALLASRPKLRFEALLEIAEWAPNRRAGKARGAGHTGRAARRRETE
jgi:hypothetical protein